jgi:hypothetical protein
MYGMKLSGNFKKLLLAGAVVLASVAIFLYNSTDISSQAVCYQLQAFGTAIYEYHAAHGQWPQGAADLAKTSLPARLRYWQEELQSGRVVVAWPQNWPPHPQDNGHYILAYFTGGLISGFGRHWVLWGDLRTEYLPSDKLTAVLKAAKGK